MESFYFAVVLLLYTMVLLAVGILTYYIPFLVLRFVSYLRGDTAMDES